MNYAEILVILEDYRQSTLKKLKIGIVIFILLGIIGYFVFKHVGIAVGLVLGVIITIVLVARSSTKFYDIFKENLMPIIIAKTGLELKYDPEEGLREEVIMESKLFPRPDRYESEDLMYGTYEDIYIRRSDVHMEVEKIEKDEDGNKKITYDTIFKGSWFVFDFNKTFDGMIQVREDNFFERPQFGLKLKKYKLEDVEFNKKFKTYSTDQQNAFYVLTPTLMMQLKKLEKRFPGRIYFSFLGKELHVAIFNGKNSFEPSIFKQVDDDFVTEQVEEIIILKEIIEELRLNRKIFK